MSSSLLVGIEMVAIFGLVLGFGVWQLWSLRRDNARAKAKEAEHQLLETSQTDTEQPPD
jgi:heme/copper-type cytochrome/quinol oxidase subunit 2